jgi:hypothetical protein
VAAENSVRQLGDRLGSEASENQFLRKASAAQGRYERAQATGRIDILGSVGTQQEHRLVAQAAGEVVDELDRGGIGPVQVV